MHAHSAVNNAFYDTLGDDWYAASDHPVALLRAESEGRNPWIADRIERAMKANAARVLDIGCGAGFLANYLARRGHEVVGIDLSESSLAVARKHDGARTVRYAVASAYHLPFPDGAFTAVCSTDMLEHVEAPEIVIAEAARVLAPGGVFVYFTLNRTWLAWATAVKGLELLVRNAPRNIHVYRMLLRPCEVAEWCMENGLRVVETSGYAPKLVSRAGIRLLLTRRVPRSFPFRFIRSMRVGYLGLARKGC